MATRAGTPGKDPQPPQEGITSIHTLANPCVAGEIQGTSENVQPYNTSSGCCGLGFLQAAATESMVPDAVGQEKAAGVWDEGEEGSSWPTFGASVGLWLPQPQVVQSGAASSERCEYRFLFKNAMNL